MATLVSCKKPMPQNTFVYNISGSPVEKLNGNVKVLTVGDSMSLKKGYFYQVHFDKKGNQLRSDFRSLYIGETDGIADTSIDEVIVNYQTFYNNNNIKSYMVGNVTDHMGSRKIRWTFDKQGVINSFGAYPPDSLIGIYQLKYDNNGNLLKTTSICQYEIIPNVFRYKNDVSVYKYDTSNRLIESALYEENILSTKTDFEYLSFDAYHNCTKFRVKRTFPHWTRPSEVDTITRKITYY